MQRAVCQPLPDSLRAQLPPHSDQFGRGENQQRPPPSPTQASPGACRPGLLSHHGCIAPCCRVVTARPTTEKNPKPKTQNKNKRTTSPPQPKNPNNHIKPLNRPDFPNPPPPPHTHSPCQKGSRVLCCRQAPTPAACSGAGSAHPLHAGKTFCSTEVKGHVGKGGFHFLAGSRKFYDREKRGQSPLLPPAARDESPRRAAAGTAIGHGGCSGVNG